MVNLPIEYSDKPVTPFGGRALMKRFIDPTGIRDHLATLDLPQGGSNRAYDPVQIIESFWLGIWTGASRYIHCDWLRQDRTLATNFGYESLPSQNRSGAQIDCRRQPEGRAKRVNTYSRFFGKFSQARNISADEAMAGVKVVLVRGDCFAPPHGAHRFAAACGWLPRPSVVVFTPTKS